MNRDQAGGVAVPRVWWDGDGFIHRAPDDQKYWCVGTNGDTGLLHDLPEGVVELAPVADAARAVETRAVLLELVYLKDGPRDDAYRAAKAAAWARARALAYPEEKP